MMPTPFRTKRLVEFHDTDMAGIMHFASFFHYMESAEHELLRKAGLSVHSKIDGQTISFPRITASCDFKAPVRCEEILDIEILLKRIGAKSLTYEFQFSHDGQAVATGTMTCVCCRIEPDKPLVSVAIPADIAEKLRKYAE